MGKFEHITDVVESLCLRSGDKLMRDKGLYLDCAEDVYLDLNLAVVKRVTRQLFEINKRTNTIELPNNSFQLSSVAVMDSCGHIIPVFRSDSLHDDIVDISAKKDCACEFKCGYQLCNTIKGYEAIKTVKSDFMPNGSPVSFTCIDRKWVDDQGFLYEQLQYPERVYLSGVWTNTIKKTEDKKLCQVELDDNGCVCDTQSNIDTICNACGFSISNFTSVCVGGNAQEFCSDPNASKWVYHCSSKIDWLGVQCGCLPAFANGCNNIYNISEDGNRLQFPSDFGFSKALVRFYETTDLKDLYIPIVFKDVFMTGLLSWSLKWNLKKQREAAVIGQRYSNEKFATISELNKYRVVDYMRMLSGKVFMPSYLNTHNEQ